MKNGKKSKQLSVGAQMKLAEELGSKIAIIMNMARARANKILLKSGHGININVDFYKLNDTPENITKEVEDV